MHHRPATAAGTIPGGTHHRESENPRGRCPASFGAEAEDRMTMRDTRNEPVNIVTLKWGGRYGSAFVNRLYRGVSRHLARPFRFLCFTDDAQGLSPPVEAWPLPAIDLPESHARTTWLKLALFADGLADMEGDCLFLDLDLLILDGIDCFFDYRRGKHCIIRNWRQKHLVFARRFSVGNSSVFRWRANTTQHVFDKFHFEMDWALSNFHPEQAYLTYGLGEKYWWPESWVQSFKRHAVPWFPLNLLMPPKIPADTRILVFHGRPDPDEAFAGWRTDRLHRRTRPALWIADY